MISVHYTGDGHILTIPFYDWFVCVNVADNDKMTEDIQVYDGSGVDVTEDYLIFKSTLNINPTGENLFQILDILRTNMDRRKH